MRKTRDDERLGRPDIGVRSGPRDRELRYHPNNRVRDPVECERAADHVWIAAQSPIPKTIRDHSNIGAFLFLWQKCAAANRAQAEHIEPIRCRLEDRNLKRIAKSSHRGGDTILTSKSVEKGLPITEMHETRCGEWEIDRLLLEMREDVQQARWVLEGQAAQEQIIDQTKNGGVQSDPQRERQHGEKREPQRLKQLAKSEANISHHGACNFVTLLSFVTKNLMQPPLRLDSIKDAVAIDFCLKSRRDAGFFRRCSLDSDTWNIEPLEVARQRLSGA